jgi:hypothetical protein
VGDVNETPVLSFWTLARYNSQHRWWAVEHWLLTHCTSLHFCHSCSGYFREWCMMEPDKCAACYARDYGVPRG